MRVKIITATAVMACLLAGPVFAAGDFQLVVNKQSSVSSLSKSDAAKYFQKKTTTWSDGSAVLVVDQKVSAAPRVAFSEAVLGKSAAAMKNYWQQQVFSGQNTPPPEKDSDAAVIEFVKANAGALGYVSKSAATDEVKVVTLGE